MANGASPGGTCLHRLQWLPGLAICIILAGAATALSDLPLLADRAVSPLIIAVVLGILVGNGLPGMLAAIPEPGFVLARGPLLRVAIVVYGFRITLADIQAVGPGAIIVSVFMVVSTLLLAYHVGRRWFRLDAASALLIGMGSSICGAAAVLGAEGVIRSRSGSVAIAVATVVVFGTAAMLSYPIFLPPVVAALDLDWDATLHGIYVGSTVHEVAQVVVAGSALGGAPVADVALITKMMRVCMLAPVLLVIGIVWHRAGNGANANGRVMIPWFAVAFLILIVIHPLFGLSNDSMERIAIADDLLLSTAMVSLGLTVRTHVIRAAGAAPLLLGALLFTYLVVGGLLINILVAWV